MPQSKEVDAWFAGYDNPMKPVVARIRAIVLAADRRIDECIKWQAPTFMYRGNLASFFPKSKKHASLMFHTGALIPGDHPRLEGEGGTSRVMKIGSVAEATSAKREIERVVKAWCDWREAVETPTAKQVSKKAAARRPAKPVSSAKRPSVSKERQGGYDEKTADRIRALLANRKDVVEKRMFGGLCFMVNGQMCCGLTKQAFMVRVGKDGYEDALAQPHARPMDFTGRPLVGMVYVDPAGYKTAPALSKWLGRALAFVTAAPRSKGRARTKAAGRAPKPRSALGAPAKRA